MSTVAPRTPPASGPPMKRGRGRQSSPLSWRWGDRLALGFSWFAGIGLCVIAAAIVGYMGYRGIQYLRPNLLAQRPALSTTQSGSGGFLDPLIGTALLTVIGVLLAVPLAIGGAIWIAEYGRPTWLARVVESSIEMVAGTPDSVTPGAQPVGVNEKLSNQVPLAKVPSRWSTIRAGCPAP